MTKNITLIVIFGLFLTAASAQSVVYVDQNALNGQNNGADWTNAFTNLYSALESAQPGVQIWVKAGVHYPTQSGNRTISFMLKPGVKLLGGFAGTESAADQRNWTLNKTILSGDIGEKGQASDNSFHVITGVGLDISTTLDGFIVSGGSATEGNYTNNDCGGALFLQPGSLANSTLQIQNCTFENNNAIVAGGAVYCAWDRDSFGVVNPVFRNCKFLQNHCTMDGGGVYKGGPAQADTSLLFESCLFYRNTLGGLGRGGGVYLKGAGNTTIFKNCAFQQDSAKSGAGGGIFIEGCGPVEHGNNIILESCVFKGNNCLTGSGFLFYELHDLGFYPTVPFSFHMKDCVFEGNKTSGSGSAFSFGLGNNADVNVKVERTIFIQNQSGNSGVVCFNALGTNIKYQLDINQCIFEYNRMMPDPFGNIYAVYCESSNKLNLNIVNTLFSNNGAGLCVLGANNGQAVTRIINCTFYNNNKYAVTKNWNPEFDHVGSFNDCYITNTIFQHEESSIYDLLFNNDPEHTTLYDYHVANTLLNVAPQSWVPGILEAFPSEAHIQWGKDALFLNPFIRDFQLQACSPAVDSGDNSIVNTLQINTDLGDNQRIKNQNVDLGCYETPNACISSTPDYGPRRRLQ